MHWNGNGISPTLVTTEEIYRCHLVCYQWLNGQCHHRQSAQVSTHPGKQLILAVEVRGDLIHGRSQVCQVRNDSYSSLCHPSPLKGQKNRHSLYKTTPFSHLGPRRPELLEDTKARLSLKRTNIKVCFYEQSLFNALYLHYWSINN